MLSVVPSLLDGEFIDKSAKDVTLEHKAICAQLTSDPNTRTICQVNLAYSGDWAAFIDQMLYEASTAYNDPEFRNSAADEGGRLTAVENMDLLIQCALSPTARPNGPNGTDSINYLGPNSSMAEMYTTVLPAAYVVTNADSSPAKGK